MEVKEYLETLTNALDKVGLLETYPTSPKPNFDGDNRVVDRRIYVEYDQATPFMVDDVSSITYRPPAGRKGAWVRIIMNSGEEIKLTAGRIEAAVKRHGQIVQLNLPWVIRSCFDDIVKAQELGVYGKEFVIIDKCLKDYNGESKVIEIPEGVETMVEYLFQGSSVEKVVFPSTMKVIPSCAFDQSERLKEVELNKGLEEIWQYAFNQTGLKKVKLPPSLQSVQEYAFSYTDIVIAEGIEHVAWVSDSAFEGTPYQAKIRKKL